MAEKRVEEEVILAKAKAVVKRQKKVAEQNPDVSWPQLLWSDFLPHVHVRIFRVWGYDIKVRRY